MNADLVKQTVTGIVNGVIGTAGTLATISLANVNHLVSIAVGAATFIYIILQIRKTLEDRKQKKTP